MNALVKEARAITPAKDIAGRLKALDWERVSKDLDAQGCAMIEDLITRQEVRWPGCTRWMAFSVAG